ncbi:MAG: hypothetical protein D6790_19210 [Caldilineae bacterium]|nr:MAG: hypothetical protein D6790_19210 [Caldilineae bacterium]
MKVIFENGEPSDKMMPKPLGRGDIAVFELCSLRKGAEPNFIFTINGRQLAYDPYKDEFFEMVLMSDPRAKKEEHYITIMNGRLILNGDIAAHREIYKFMMLSDFNEDKHMRDTSKPALYRLAKLISGNKHVPISKGGKVKHEEAIPYIDEPVPTRWGSNVDKEPQGREDEDMASLMSDTDAKALLYAIIDELDSLGLLDVVIDKGKGVMHIYFDDGNGTRKPMVTLGSTSKGVWKNIMKSRLWKNRESKPRSVANVVYADERISLRVLRTKFGSKYSEESLYRTFPQLVEA